MTPDTMRARRSAFTAFARGPAETGISLRFACAVFAPTRMATVRHWTRAQERPVTVVPGADHFVHGKLHVIRDVIARTVRRADAA